jgi:hypothetical protein
VVPIAGPSYRRTYCCAMARQDARDSGNARSSCIQRKQEQQREANSTGEVKVEEWKHEENLPGNYYTFGFWRT